MHQPGRVSVGLTARVDLMGQFVHTRVHASLREALRMPRIDVAPVEGVPMPNTRFSQLCLPPPLPAIPAPPRFLVRPQRLTRAHPLP
jgi:hypothetical protein